ncbi:MAG: response regulator transcription factor, partial [Ilumatobacteraceae bacterium]
MTKTSTQFPSSLSADQDSLASTPHHDTRANTTRPAATSNAYTSAGIAASPRALVTLRHNSDRRSIEAALERLGYSVRATNDPIATEVLLRTYGPDIIVVDVHEAYPASSDLLQQIRRCPDIHTVVVGADTDDQRIIALRNGADDAVSTDVSPDEVALRCQAILRRQQAEQSPFVGGNPRVLYFGPLSIDLGRREIRVDRRVIPATRLEFDLFAHLCQRPLEVCSRPDLLTGVWGPH